MKSLHYFLTMIVVSSLIFVGCGQKGPLYFPKNTTISKEEQQQRDEQLKEIEENQAPTQY